MSTKQPRHTPLPAPSLSTNHSASKFPKFLQKQANRKAPVIVEPLPIPRPRTRSERPLASAPDSLHSSSQLYSSTSSTSRIGNLPTRLSGWFSHTFSSSSTDIPILLAYHSTASLRGKGPSALLMAAKHGKGHLDKAMRYPLDSDAMGWGCMLRTGQSLLANA